MSPLPLPAMPPVRAMPRPARRASRCSWRASSGASVAMTKMTEPLSGRWRSGPTASRVTLGDQRRADAHAVDDQLLEPAVVRERQCRHGVGTRAGGLDRLSGRASAPRRSPARRVARPTRCRPSARGRPCRCRPRWRHRWPRPASAPRAASMAARTSSTSTWTWRASFRNASEHSATTGIIQWSASDAGRLVDEDPDGGVVDPPDGHRRGQQDGALEGAELVDLGPTADLARAVEDGDAGLDRMAGEGLEVARQDGRHAGPRRATAGRRSRLVAPDGRVADPHAGHVDDRVRRARRHQADDDPEVARAAAGRRRPAGRHSARRRGACDRGCARCAIVGHGASRSCAGWPARTDQDAVRR